MNIIGRACFFIPFLITTQPYANETIEAKIANSGNETQKILQPSDDDAEKKIVMNEANSAQVQKLF